jgi:hypothetical protein
MDLAAAITQKDKTSATEGRKDQKRTQTGIGY